MTLLHKMREGGVTANMISFRSAISACVKGRQRQQALALLNKMRTNGMTARVIRFNMRERIMIANVTIFNVAISTQ